MIKSYSANARASASILFMASFSYQKRYMKIHVIFTLGNWKHHKEMKRKRRKKQLQHCLATKVNTCCLVIVESPFPLLVYLKQEK